MLRQTVTENGKVKGLPGNDPRITVYKGIPFAKPPVGDLRWAPPVKCDDWEGEKEAYAFAPISVQDTPGIGDDLYTREWHVDPGIEISEDCLYLNIWTPADKTDEKLPVFVWYFGGVFQWGYTAEMEFNGERLASRGIIVVSINYRLGAFGFLSHPDITKEYPDAPGNFGFLDQQFGLEWVYRNIENFGGDPDNITIGGQSAGGASVMNQLANEKSAKYIKGAVVLSGMIRMPELMADLFKAIPLSDAESEGEEFIKFLGVSSIAEARKLDAFFIRAKYAEYASTHRRFVGIMDGSFCTGDHIEKFINKEYANVPVLAGNTTNEFIDNGINRVEETVKNTFNEALKKDPSRKFYYYRFRPQIPGDDNPGCFHSCDLWFFFETLMMCKRPYKGDHYELADKMCSYLANFVKKKDPNGYDKCNELLPQWDNYTQDVRAEMEFTTQGAKPRIESIRPPQAYNPYLPSWEYIPDGEPYVFGNRVYVYGSHDRFRGPTFCDNDYVCWSADINRLYDWRYEGVTYPKTSDPVNADGTMCLYAPDVTVGPDGRYYLFYVLDRTNHVSVAVSDTPAGRFKFLGNVHYEDGTLLGDKEGDEPQFDPGVLTEGEFTYLFTGFCGQGDPNRHGAMLVKLGPDMLTIKSDLKFVVPGNVYSKGTSFEGHAFFEAPSIRKRNGLYYFIYSSEVMHELCYAISDRIDGEYTYGGVIVSNADKGIGSYKDPSLSMAYSGNNHGSIVQIKDDWYIFYHRQTNNTWFSRQGCAEKISFTGDGHIIQAEMTSCGLNGAPLSDLGEYPAYIACNLFTDDHFLYVGDDPAAPHITQDGRDGDENDGYVTSIKDGVTAGFKYFNLKGAKGLRIWTRGYIRGFFEIRTKWDGEVLGKIKVENENIWTPKECAVSFPDGISALYLTFRGDGNGGNLKGFEFLH